MVSVFTGLILVSPLGVGVGVVVVVVPFVVGPATAKASHSLIRCLKNFSTVSYVGLVSTPRVDLTSEVRNFASPFFSISNLTMWFNPLVRRLGSGA